MQLVIDDLGLVALYGVRWVITESNDIQLNKVYSCRIKRWSLLVYPTTQLSLADSCFVQEYPFLIVLFHLMGDLRSQAYQRPYQGRRWRLNWETETKFALVSAVQLVSYCSLLVSVSPS